MESHSEVEYVKEDGTECEVGILSDFVVRKEDLISAQREDENLKSLWSEAVREGASDDEDVGYYVENEILMRE